MNIVYNYSGFKIKLAQIFLSHFRFILDLKDFITNTVIGIGKCANIRMTSEGSRYHRYSLDKIIEWDQKLVLEMTLIKIFSEYERFLQVFFYEIRKIGEKYIEGYPKRTKNIIKFSEYFTKVFQIDIVHELDCWEDLVENYYRRNAIVHTKGKIGIDYIKNVNGTLSEDKSKKLTISLGYMGNCIENILSFFEFIFIKIIVFFHLDNMDQISSELNKRRIYGIDQSFFTRFRLRARV